MFAVFKAYLPESAYQAASGCPACTPQSREVRKGRSRVIGGRVVPGDLALAPVLIAPRIVARGVFQTGNGERPDFASGGFALSFGQTKTKSRPRRAFGGRRQRRKVEAQVSFARVAQVGGVPDSQNLVIAEVAPAKNPAAPHVRVGAPALPGRNESRSGLNYRAREGSGFRRGTSAQKRENAKK